MLYAAVCDCRLPDEFLYCAFKPVLLHPAPVSVPHVLAAGLPQKAIVTVLGTVVVNPVIETAVPVGPLFAAATCMPHELVLRVGL